MKYTADKLRSLGYEVVSRWLRDTLPVGMDDTTHGDAQRVAWRNIQDLMSADVVLAIGPDIDSPRVMFELGVARTTGARIVIAGAKSLHHMYEHLVSEEFDTLPEAIERFKRASMWRHKKTSPDVIDVY